MVKKKKAVETGVVFGLRGEIKLWQGTGGLSEVTDPACGFVGCTVQLSIIVQGKLVPGPFTDTEIQGCSSPQMKVLGLHKLCKAFSCILYIIPR